MRDDVPCEFPAGYDDSAILERLAQVLDPELDESILALGFVRSVELRSGHARIALRLPTSWCAVNFTYLMAEDVRRALLSIAGIRQVTVSLGDHCAAAEIEAALNKGLPFAEAFPGEAAGSLEALRLTFLRKGFLSRQERLLRELRGAGCSTATICVLRLGDVSMQDGGIAIRQPGRAAVESGSAAVLQRYLERRAETRARLQLSRTADRRSRREAIFRGAVASPLRSCPHRARRTGGQWLILPCPTERAALRCRRIGEASNSESDK